MRIRGGSAQYELTNHTLTKLRRTDSNTTAYDSDGRVRLKTVENPSTTLLAFNDLSNKGGARLALVMISNDGRLTMWDRAARVCSQSLG
jgi:hypothetical protein